MTHYINGNTLPHGLMLDIEKLLHSASTTNKRKANRSVKEYEVLASFDIETSNITVNGETRNVVYVWTFSLMNFEDRHTVTADSVKNTLTIVGRTMWHFELLLRELVEIAEYNINVYVHNLNYELDRILYNCPTARRTLQVDDGINIATHTPLTTVCGPIVFKDSWKLFNASLAEVGRQYGIPKLDYEYDSVRLPNSKLTEHDYAYNTNDVYIVLYALCRLCVNNGIDSVTKIPSTSTRLTVYRNEHTAAINPLIDKYHRVRKSHGRVVQDTRKVYLVDKYKEVVKNNELPEEQIPFWEHLFAGGYSHGNIYGVAKVWEDVLSCDFCSAYPGAMVSCAYPYGIEKVEAKLLSNVNYLRDSNREWLGGVTPTNIAKRQQQPCKAWYAATITIAHLKVKVHGTGDRRWCSPVISSYKLLNDMREIRSMKIDNGRLLEGVNVKLEVNALDMLAIELAYEDFEIVSCEELYLASTQRPMHEYKLRTIKKWYTDKTGLKKLQKWCANPNRDLVKEDFICDAYQLVDENGVDAMIKMSKSNVAEFKNVIDDMYLKSKNCLNGQYGIMVMHINRDNVFINLNESGYEYKAGQMITTKQKELYVHGICITSYTRLFLIAFTAYVAERTDCTPLYWDTDSVKFALNNTSKEKLHSVVMEWNKGVSKWSDDMPAEIGTMDDGDGEYSHFIYLGAKRYMYREFNSRTKKFEIHLTVAGLPKRNAAKYYTELYEEFGQDFYMLADCFRPNVFIHENLCGKLVPEYADPTKTDLHVKGKFLDCDGVESEVDEWGGFLLRSVPFALVDLSKPENLMYYLAVSKLQGKDYLPDAEYPEIVLKRNETTGKVEVLKGRIDTPELWVALYGSEVVKEYV